MFTIRLSHYSGSYVHICLYSYVSNSILQIWLLDKRIVITTEVYETGDKVNKSKTYAINTYISAQEESSVRK